MNRKNRKAARCNLEACFHICGHIQKFMNLQMCLCANICICKSSCFCKWMCKDTFTFIYVNVQANIHAYLVDLKPFLLVKGNQSMVQNTHIDLFYRIWSIRFLRYWLIDKSTELLKLKKQSSNWDLKLEQNTVEHNVVHFGTILWRVNIHAS